MSEPARQHEDILHFWSLALRLKQQQRTGWVDRGVDHPESIADHSWGVALLSWLLAREYSDLDRDRILLLGLVHDLPEAIAGDATPFDEHRTEDGVIDTRFFRTAPYYSESSRATKREAEMAALTELLAGLPDDLAAELRAGWIEYDESRTPEARFVRQVDKLETLLQAEAYVDRQPDLIVDSFRIGVQRDLTDAGLANLAEARIRGRRT